MAQAEMARQSGERRRRTSRTGSILNVHFNGGGAFLLLGAAAGAFLAAAFSAHRVRAHKRKRGSMTEGIQNSAEQLASHEAKEFVGIEGEVGNGANTGDGGIQVNSPEYLDASFQNSEVVQRESDFNLLEKKGEGPERSPTRDIEQADRARGELPGFRDSSADVGYSPVSTWRNLGIGCSLGECQLGYDDEELMTTSVTEEGETPCINSKEDDGEHNKKAYAEEWSEREEIEEKSTSPNLYSEQLGLLKNNNLKISEKTPEIEELHLEAVIQELETSASKEVEEEGKDETISVLSHELQTRQYLEADKDKRADSLEMKTVFAKIVGVDEILKEAQDQIKEQEEQIAKLSFDVVEEGVKTADKAMKQDKMMHLIDMEKKYQRQLEAHEKGKQQRTAAKKENGTEYMFIGYPKAHFFLTLLATVFAVLAFLYHEGFYHQNNYLGNFYHRLSQLFYSS